MHPRGEISKKFFPIGLLVCVLLLGAEPWADAAQNSNGSKKVESSASPSSTPKGELNGDPNKAEKAGTEKRGDPQPKVSQKPMKSPQPVSKKSAKSEQSDTGKEKADFKKNSKNAKEFSKEKNVKEEKTLKANEKRPEKVMATAAAEPVNKAQEPTPTPDVMSPSPEPTGLSAEIEKSDGNKATLVVSGVKEGTQVKVVITSKDAKKK